MHVDEIVLMKPYDSKIVFASKTLRKHQPHVGEKKGLKCNFFL